MNYNQDNIDSLIIKLISGNASPEEKYLLDEWVSKSTENGNILVEFQKAWDLSANFINQNQIQTDKFKLKESYLKFISERISSIRRYSAFYRVAAILAFPVALLIGWLIFRTPADSMATGQFCEVISPKGHVSKCILPDGSQVWINTGSRIIYNTVVFNSENREVRLEGEAYFEVTVNEEKPFRVITEDVDINVTGTSFNISSYAGSDDFEAVLTEGSVNLELKSVNKVVDLDPGQRIIFNLQKQNIEIQSVDAEIYTAWRNSELIFKDATLNDLIAELERIYDIRFHLRPAGLGNFRFRGMFSYNNNLIEALEKIKKTSGIDYYIERKEVWLKSSN